MPFCVDAYNCEPEEDGQAAGVEDCHFRGWDGWCGEWDRG